MMINAKFDVKAIHILMLGIHNVIHLITKVDFLPTEEKFGHRRDKSVGSFQYDLGGTQSWVHIITTLTTQ